VRSARAPFVLVLQPGDEPQPGLVARAAESLAADADIGLLALCVRPSAADASAEPLPATDLASLLSGPERLARATAFRRELWEAIGGYDESLDGVDEYDFWLTALERGFRARVLDQPRVCRRSAEGPLARRALERDRHLATLGALFHKHRAAFERHVIDVLCGREARCHGVRERERALVDRRDRLRAELGALNEEIAALTRRLADAGRPRVDWGDLRRTTPLSPVWGYDRGQPVDRWYIEHFLEEHAADVQGVVLEVQEPDYTLRFGKDRVQRSDVLDVDAANPRATIVADLRTAAEVPEGAYDCVILTQTLHVIDDMRAAVGTLFRILKPGGVLLATLPCASRVCLEYGQDGDFWRLTEAGARRLFGEFFPPGELEVRSFGNVLTCAAFLYGLASQELTPEELAAFDPYHPLLVGVRARKPATLRAALRPLRRAASRGAVLLYHRVSAEDGPDLHGLRVRPEEFRAQMEVLRRRYRPMALEEMVRAAAAGELPQGAVALTFDDGYLDNLTTASPILLDLGLPATFFITVEPLDHEREFWWDALERVLTGGHALPPALELSLNGRVERFATATPDERLAVHRALHAALVTAPPAQRDHALRALMRWSGQTAGPSSSRRPMTADEVRQLAARPGHAIGAHGVHHLALSVHPYEIQRQEIVEGALALRRLLGDEVASFAYPFGNYGREAVEIVRAARFCAALTCDEGAVTSETDPLRLPRVETSGGVAEWTSRLEAHLEARPEAAPDTPSERAGAG
jgi:peptidoglycan/xylan/chitin deacetylase (PgdA/CDA1 family)